ncbi:MAG: plastocyanin/azurin family copper-binding protein [Ginsengibacter sp.]
MKKILLPLFCFLMFESQARTWTVNVTNFQFSPASMNVSVGDVIHWTWGSGFHTTTSLSVPAGATTWNAGLNKAGDFFDYTITTSGSYSYQCDVHPAQMQGTFTATAVLPVTLSAFNISDKNGKAALAWTTLTETNVNYFSIRKSLDGSDFKEIGRIPATGNSSLQKNYSFTDDKITSSTRYAYYTLAIVDKDGKMQLSPMKLFRNKKANPKIIISLSPNPVSVIGHLLIKFNADKPGLMQAKVLDEQGKLILKTEMSTVQGINNSHVHLGGIAKGKYTIQFTLDDLHESYNIIKN